MSLGQKRRHTHGNRPLWPTKELHLSIEGETRIETRPLSRASTPFTETPTLPKPSDPISFGTATGAGRGNSTASITGAGSTQQPIRDRHPSSPIQNLLPNHEKQVKWPKRETTSRDFAQRSWDFQSKFRGKRTKGSRLDEMRPVRLVGKKLET